ESFSCFANGNQSDVVVLRDRTGKVANVLDDFSYNCLRPIDRAGANRLDHAIETELVSVGIKCFGHTVGVEDEAITALERDGEVDSKPIEHVSAVNAHDHSRGFYWRNHF